MLKLYYTLQKTPSREFLWHVLELYHGVKRQDLLYGEHGKPFLKNNSVFFSISHTDELTAVAVSDTPVGLDVEYTKKQRNYTAVFNRLSPQEQAEIKNDTGFFAHWTVKESYVKYCGETLATLYKELRYTDGALKKSGKPVAVALQNGTLGNGKYVYSVCFEKEEPAEVIEIFL